MLKRCFDVLVSVIGLIVLSPLLALVALLILLTDSWPVLFAQRRVGRFGRPFTLLKFRTMTSSDREPGSSITLGSKDARVTRLGGVLRKYKLDELPQLINVLRGEMSLVGPRPEVEDYVRLYTKHQRRVLEIRPGCTDITVIRGHAHDAALLDGRDDPEAYYTETVMPKKLRDNLYYLEHRSFLLDLRILVGSMLTIIGWRGNPAPITHGGAAPVGSNVEPSGNRAMPSE